MKSQPVQRALGKLFDAALAISAKRGWRKICVELFSGTGRIGHTLERLGCGCVCIDIKYGPFHDLTARAVQSVIYGSLADVSLLCR